MVLYVFLTTVAFDLHTQWADRCRLRRTQPRDGRYRDNERVLTEIIVTATNAELKALKARYQEKFTDLVDHIHGEVMETIAIFSFSASRTAYGHHPRTRPGRTASQL